jgi:hypothetical protein
MINALVSIYHNFLLHLSSPFIQNIRAKTPQNKSTSRTQHVAFNHATQVCRVAQQQKQEK